MKLEIKFGSPNSYDYETLLDQFSGTKINSNSTSSIPLMQFWQKTEERLLMLFEEIGLTSNNPILCFEYPTKTQEGKGKSSMTDLMIINSNEKIAIEAKFTEYYKIKSNSGLIKNWKNKGNTENRIKVLGYWTSLIEKFSNGDLTNIDEIDYQFYHRTASACKDAKSAVVIYQLFYNNKTKDDLDLYKNKLKEYVKIINPNESLLFYIWEVKVLEKIEIQPGNNPFLEMKEHSVYEILESKISKVMNIKP